MQNLKEVLGRLACSVVHNENVRNHKLDVTTDLKREPIEVAKKSRQ
jgi:hypothetical protein